MENEYGFNREQSRTLRFCCANDFSKGAIEDKKKKLEELEKQLVRYERDISELDNNA